METSTPPPPAGPEASPGDYKSFHEYRWDLDVEFLKGVVLACGGLRALERTGSQAEIILHSRIFYFARLAGVTVPYAGYRRWLRENRQFGPVDWDLLGRLCDRKDAQLSRGAPAAAPGPAAPGGRDGPEARREKEAWLRELYGEDGPEPPDPSVPSWQAAAPRGALVVDHGALAGEGQGKGAGGGAPYPERFAMIIEAIQSGKPVEGIQEIPSNLARNPDTTPFGRMAAPRKPWEKAAAEPRAAEPDSAVIDRSFPDAEDDD